MGHKIIHIGRSFRHLISGERTHPGKNAKTSFRTSKVCYKISIQTNLLQQIVQLSSNNFTVKKLSGLIDFSGKYRQFSVPTQHENLDVSAHGTQRLRYCPAC
jgi:hypothetical protein